MMHKIAMPILNAIINDNEDKGLEIPITGPKVFTNNPANIRNETLNPTDKTNFLAKLIPSNLSEYRIKKPGSIVKQINAKTTLKIGKSKNIVRSVKRIINVIIINFPLASQLFIKNLIIFDIVAPTHWFFSDYYISQCNFIC